MLTGLGGNISTVDEAELSATIGNRNDFCAHPPKIDLNQYENEKSVISGRAIFF